MTSLLDIKNLKTVFETNKGVIKAVDGVSLCLTAGETLGVVGESGCGKTMLALSIMRLIPGNGNIIDGEILFSGQDLLKISPEEMRLKRGSEIAMIFQEPMTSLNPVLRVGEQIAESIRLHQNISAQDITSLVIKQMRDVGISEPEKRVQDYPHQLSGGMRQRIMIAMAMSCHPKLLLADEPTTALDVTIQAQILELIDELKTKNNMAVIFITHDLGIIAQTADKVAVMYAGRIVESAVADDLFAHPLHPYTEGLIASMPAKSPDISEGQNYLKTIPGSVPSLYALPQGCSFSDRCSSVMDICRKTEPFLCEIEETHLVSCWKYNGKSHAH